MSSILNQELPSIVLYSETILPRSLIKTSQYPFPDHVHSINPISTRHSSLQYGYGAYTVVVLPRLSARDPLLCPLAHAQAYRMENLPPAHQTSAYARSALLRPRCLPLGPVAPAAISTADRPIRLYQLPRRRGGL